MSRLEIEKTAIPDLSGKIAVVTGGASGIGLATAKLLLDKNATVHIFDLTEPEEDEDWMDWPKFHVHRADIRDWRQLSDAFSKVDLVDFVFANAGLALVATGDAFVAETLDDQGRLQEPSYIELDTNLRGVLNTIKLAWFQMKKNRREGSIVLTCATTGYWPDYVVPVYAGTAAAQIGIIRSLRNALQQDGITINGVAAGSTITKMLPYAYAVPLINEGIAVSAAEHVATALVYSAVAHEERKVEIYGREPAHHLHVPGRWNGRVIVALGDKYRETEEVLADSREFWYGKQFCKWTIMQQSATDFRGSDGSRTDSLAESVAASVAESPN
ncbi:unnamed protein product [Discula destructiva]